MGAQQSSPDGDGARSGTNTVLQKTCYYEVLGVGSTVDDSEIRKAYKRKALELHPDRNYNDEENATKKFAEIQTAYEVLSDPQERAWYDAHRDAILRGADADLDVNDAPSRHDGVRLTTADELMSLIGRFNSRVPFNDSPSGFYGVIGATFAQLATEETAASQCKGQSLPSYPSFGSANDDYGSVVRPFYAAWAKFSTCKSFGWAEKWRLAEAPDRQVRRLMEKENKKIREGSICEFNEAVRFLVAFVRKRDPRCCVPNKLSEADRQKALRASAATQAARARAANQDRLASEAPILAEWARVGVEPEIHEEYASSEEEGELESFECVVCEKSFKSENQLEAHEKSKKHRKTVQQARQHMEQEGHGLDLDWDLPPSPRETEEAPKKEDYSGAKDSEIQFGTSPTPASILEETGVSRGMVGSDTPSLSGDSLEDEFASREVVEKRLALPPIHNGLQDDEEQVDGLSLKLEGATLEDDDLAMPRRLGKAKAKRAKKAAQAAQVRAQDSWKCNLCEEMFSSRTKLFKHVSNEGHAKPISKVKPATQSSQKGKKNKR